jgi:hypothetical protein
MDDEEPEVRATLAAIGAWEIAAALLTRTRPGSAAGGGTYAYSGGAETPTGAGMAESGSWSQQSMPAAPRGELVRPGVGEGVMSVNRDGSSV